MRALSIRQPYAEMILRGMKRMEYRSRPTRIIGERFYIYAARRWSPGVGSSGKKLLADNLTGGQPPPWIVELAKSMHLLKEELPTGLIVGSAVIAKVTPRDAFFEWHLADVERATQLLRPTRHPQPVWFHPF